MTVSLRVGSLHKSFDVVGNRFWKTGIFMVGATAPEPFTMMPISYNNAFGGVDRSQDDPLKHRWYPTNHAGVGYHEYLDAEFVDGKPLPNTEETGRRITDPRGKYRPMAFGSIGRAWQPRPKYAGTYDQKWLDDVSPFLPADFKEDYYQAAPADQQIPHSRDELNVELTNLSPEGVKRFIVPQPDVPVLFIFRNEPDKKASAVLDTILIEPDQSRFAATWRTSVPIRRNIFEFRSVVVGIMPRGWHLARERGKTYYRSLSEAIAARRG